MEKGNPEVFQVRGRSFALIFDSLGGRFTINGPIMEMRSVVLGAKIEFEESIIEPVCEGTATTLSGALQQGKVWLEDNWDLIRSRFKQ